MSTAPSAPCAPSLARTASSPSGRRPAPGRRPSREVAFGAGSAPVRIARGLSYTSDNVFGIVRLAVPGELSIASSWDGGDVLNVRVGRPSGVALRWQDLRAVRLALAARAPAGMRVVVSDAAQLRGMRDRALAPLVDPAVRPTAEVMRARLARSMEGPKLPLP